MKGGRPADPPQDPAVLPAHIFHASFAAYQRYGCRCGKCQEFVRAYARNRKRTPPPLDVDDFKHGTVAAYNYRRCRCDDCRAARRSYDRHLSEIRQRRALEQDDQGP